MIRLAGVAAGVRRIEAICGLETLKAYQRDRDELARAAAALTARPGELAARITSLADEHKRLVREIQQARMKAAMGSGGNSEPSNGDAMGLLAQALAPQPGALSKTLEKTVQAFDGNSDHLPLVLPNAAITARGR